MLPRPVVLDLRTEKDSKVLRLGLVCSWNGSWNSLVYTLLTDDIGDVKMQK